MTVVKGEYLINMKLTSMEGENDIKFGFVVIQERDRVWQIIPKEVPILIFLPIIFTKSAAKYSQQIYKKLCINH